MQAPRPVIECKDITKHFVLTQDKIFEALRGVNLEVRAGEFVILFGPSGSGKTTLLNLVAGLDRPSSGSIKIRGTDITKFSSKELALHHRTKIGMVFQQFNLISTLSIIDNVALPQVFANRPIKSRRDRALHLLEIFGLDKYAGNVPAELSGGEQQRVAIARALVNNPWILLVDEPTGNLDSKTGVEVMKILLDLNRQSKRTILMVTHNANYLKIAHRIVYFLDGKNVKTQKKRTFIHHHKAKAKGNFASLSEEKLGE